MADSVPGVAEAYVYGSWAARYRGQAGDVPRDVDVLVIGDADEDDLYEAARAAERTRLAAQLKAGLPLIWAAFSANGETTKSLPSLDRPPTGH